MYWVGVGMYLLVVSIIVSTLWLSITSYTNKSFQQSCIICYVIVMHVEFSIGLILLTPETYLQSKK